MFPPRVDMTMNAWICKKRPDNATITTLYYITPPLYNILTKNPPLHHQLFTSIQFNKSCSTRVINIFNINNHSQ